jgi:hypothetical protein
MTENSGIKRCGIVRRGVACGTVIPVSARACAECAASVVAELERMADEPVAPIVPRGTPLATRGTEMRERDGAPLWRTESDRLGNSWRVPKR